MRSYIFGIPKAELHIHIEGSLEPELMFKLAKRNAVPIPFDSPEAVRRRYRFTDLQSFLDIYYQGTSVLRHEEDFYEMTWAYLKKACEQNIRHTEIFFDPQAHTERGLPFETVITGIQRALVTARKEMRISSKLIMCFLRHLSVESAMETLNRALPFKKWITAVGLDSSELGNPPKKFTAVFDKARKEDLLTVAHAGEEGPPEYIWQALEYLGVSRIDHGVRCIEDARLTKKLIENQIPLTVCPLSNVKLGVFDDMKKHNLKEMLDLGLCVTVNSDDPAYFGGYIVENLQSLNDSLGLDYQDIYRLAKNAFQASFITRNEKKVFLEELDKFEI
jgi:adenosine deaminase